jgi:hypothetical protein
LIGRKRLSGLHALSVAVRAELGDRLEDDESVQWIGKPVVGKAWAEGEPSLTNTRLSRFLSIVLKSLIVGPPAFFLVVGGAAVIQETFREGWPGIGQIIVTAFLLGILAWLAFAGWALISSPFFMMWQAKRTDYVLTNRRAFVLRDFKGGVSIRSWRLAALDPEVLRETKSGVGDVVFEREAVGVNSVDMGSGSVEMDLGFSSVRNPHRVAERITALRDAINPPDSEPI